MDVSQTVRTCEDQIIRWRREFHEHPELAYREEWTSGRIQEELKKLGIPFDLVKTIKPKEVWTPFGVPPEAVDKPLGIVGRLQGTGKGPGKKFALRADIDALPMQEETTVPFKSKIDGAMHSCGHDAHAAMLLGAAKALSEHRDAFSGTIYLCFQCAEEIAGGAAEIVKYLKDKGGVDGVAALHVFANIPAGKICLKPGPMMAGLFPFVIDIKGQGGHGSRPDLSRDPIKPAADLILKLSSIPSNFYEVFGDSVVHVCEVHGGTAHNIFPDTAMLSGAVRFFKKKGNVKLLKVIRRIVKGVGETYNVDVDFKEVLVLGPVINNADFIRRARTVVPGIPGLSILELADPFAGSDDFSEFLDTFPGFYGILGVANEAKGIKWEQHNSHFDMDESALVKGSEFLCRCALEFAK
ncbi:MAG: amidohydrolase [Spirochaetaceae bacterium]|jgi:amidohydrolase|nr:amidohydrolase [Spirochaetaceae bacterium]